MSSLRLAIVSIVSLCIGGAIGYWIHPTLAPSPSTAAAPKAAHPSAAAVTAPTAVVAPAAIAPAEAPAQTPTSFSPSIRERIAILHWQRSLGSTSFTQLFSDKSVNLTVVKYLDLTPAEQMRLMVASRTAQEEVTRLRDAGATSRMSDDHKKLIVEVPGLDPAASRAVYDRFNTEVAATLDPDRRELLNLLTGESADRLHDRFGLNPIRYELTLAPRQMPNGRTVYEYKRSFVDADGTGSGSSSGMLSLDDIAKTAPTLARFLPTGQSATPKP